MQLAIAMSSSLSEQRSSGSHAAASGGNTNGTVQSRPPIHVGDFIDRGKRQSEPKDKAVPIAGKGLGLVKQSDAVAHNKAAGLGLAGDYAWVDNSDFHSSQAPEQKAAAAPKRSA